MKKVVLSLAAVILCAEANAQVKVGDNPTNVNGSAVLEAESTTKGFLPPRMTSVQRDAIGNPTDGLMIFNTTTGNIEVFSTPLGGWTAISATVIPALPGAPTAVSATAGNNADATVSFTPPVLTGGAITTYTATSSPGNITGTSATSPVTVAGLTPGTSYTFTVTATNATGASAPSAPSNSITIGGATLNCAGATVSATIPNNMPISGQTITIPYTGGNGGTYGSAVFNATPSLFAGSLAASLSAGAFASGSGNLTLQLSGLPGDVGTASITISTGGSSCAVSVPVYGAPCTTPSFTSVSHTPSTYITSTDADLGGAQGSFTASVANMTSATWTLSSLPSGGVLSGATSGSGTTASVNLLPGARGRVIITWTATDSSGTCTPASAAKQDTLVVGDAILYGMQKAGCSSCAIYDTTSIDEWVNVTAAEYDSVASGMNTAGIPDANLANNNGGSTFGGFANRISYATGTGVNSVPAGDYLVAFRAQLNYVVNSPLTGYNIKLRGSANGLICDNTPLTIRHTPSNAVLSAIKKRPSSIFNTTSSALPVAFYDANGVVRGFWGFNNIKDNNYANLCSGGGWLSSTGGPAFQVKTAGAKAW